jgi:hypothetical protein
MAEESWPWPDELDGVLAAPRSHRVLIDNDSSPPGAPARQTKASWMPPEGPHSVENIDSQAYHAIRVELKDQP